MGASITLAGESLIAQKLGSQQRLDVVRFIFANVPGLDPNAPVNRAAAKPPAAQIVHSYTIPQQNVGYVNPNQVVYSSMLGSDVGDFDWNWIGLETAENVLLAVAYMPLQQKRKNIPPLQLGNNVTRNILVMFDGAQALTGITIDAKTWQHDFTVRLKGIDERERLSNRDIFGRACFFGNAFQVEKVGTAYQLKAGLAYVEGVRIELSAAVAIAPTQMPTQVWLQVSLRRELNDVVAAWKVAFEPNQVDFLDGNGQRVYCIALADLTTAAISDRRVVEPINGSLIQHLAARNGDYQYLRARATTKADVGLGNLPNAISDDAGTNSSEILASTKAVSSVRQALQQDITKLVDGTTPAGKAKQLETARKVSISGVGTGSATFDGTADVNIQVTMPDIVASWKYTKVTVNSKGLVTYGESLQPVDIPGLDWSKITSGTPTTLAGYGITNALPLGYTDKRPQLYAPSPGRNHVNGALEIREAQLVLDAQSDFDYAPRMIFHWGTLNAGDLAMTSFGQLCWNGKAIWHEGNFNPNTKADKATTLVGYGITDALFIGKVSRQRPVLSAPDPGGVSGAGGALEIREAKEVRATTTDVAYAPAITFHWADFFGRQLAMDSKGDLRWNGQLLWHANNFEPTAVVPAGAIMAFAMTSIPTGYIKASGAAVSRVAYAALFAQIGTYYGAGDGATTFNLPDLRGVFVRGLDEGRGLDPGRVFGTFQGSQNASHSHSASSDVQGAHSHGMYPIALNIASGQGGGHYSVGPSPTAAGPTAGAHNHTITVDASGGNESRPVSVAMIYCIKY
ncbi:phage tail protein [Pseudomonas yamanorum]|uniref:phage tail-collar fiber domain-containing protein n=1 Tax=Pseudomonas yamanorum TaxID=515393 RepID=UPI0015A3D504|nr:phage tail protein [Pseudomonas yamanorum]NWD24862.1 phage tail protein [Pseudomonas yamanorum]